MILSLCFSCFILQRIHIMNCFLCTVASRLCISAMSRLSVRQLSQVGVKEISQEALHPDWLGGLSSWIQSQVQDLCGVKCSGASLGSVETLDGAGQPDEPFETLDVSAPVVHQLVLSHSSATAGRWRTRRIPQFTSLHNSYLNSVNTWTFYPHTTIQNTCKRAKKGWRDI